jgi:hypothetical protein
MSVVDDIAQAIQKMEGFYPGSLSYRNNNPGNLRNSSGGYATYPDYQTGYDALTHQVELNISRGLTLTEFFGGKQGVYSGYAPSADGNNPLQYALTVSQQTGIPIDVPLNNVAGNLPTKASNVQYTNTVSSSGNTSDNAGESIPTSESPIDLSAISLFDSEGNFAPTPIGLVLVIGSVTLLVLGLME